MWDEHTLQSTHYRRTLVLAKETLHRRVHELIDCLATTDPLKEMDMLHREAHPQEAALKWVALAALHGFSSGAKEISLSRSEEGEVRVTAEYRKAELPLLPSWKNKASDKMGQRPYFGTIYRPL
jgi:hypothetical protein